MDCHRSEQQFRQTHCPTDEDSIDANVKKAMECLQISVQNECLSAATHHSSHPQIGGDCMTDNQNDRQTKEEAKDILCSQLLTTQSSHSLDNCFTSDAIPEEILNVFKAEEAMEGYSSDSVYESSSDTEYVDKRVESCDQSCDVQNQSNNVNVVIDSDPLLATKYPLKYKWQFWFWRADQGVKVVWEEALQRVCKPFDTVENFWRLYHHIIPVRQLVPPSDYCVFKEGVSPMWEDSHNINGGKWTLDFAKGPNRTINAHLDEIWLEVLLCLVGEGFNEFGEDICGAVVNIRSKEDRISVWTANANKSVSNLKIGEILKIRSGYEGRIKYEAHTTSQRIAEAKDRLFDNRLTLSSKPKPKSMRRSCVF